MFKTPLNGGVFCYPYRVKSFKLSPLSLEAARKSGFFIALSFSIALSLWDTSTKAKNIRNEQDGGGNARQRPS